MSDKKNAGCTVCSKKIKDIKVLVEVQLEMFGRYVREDGVLEDMNGLWKKTRENFCEECFNKYTEMLESFYKSRVKPD